MASHVSEIECKEEVGLLSEIDLPEANTREIQPTIHLDHEREIWTSVTVQEKPLFPKCDVMKAFQNEKIEVKDMDTRDNATLSEVMSEKCLHTVHQDDDLANFETVTICKENIYLPHTIENVVQSQECQVGVEETEEMFVPEYTVEKASVSVCRSEDPTDYGLVNVKKTKVCYPCDTERAVQIQETVENTYMSSEFCLPNISTEKAFTCVHKDLEPQGVAVISEPIVFDWHDTAKCVQLQEIEEETDECEDMSFPYIDAEETFATVHEKITSKDLGVATSNQATVCHHLDLKVGHIKTEMEEEGMTNEVVPLDVPGEFCQVTTHQDQNVKEFDAVDVSKNMLHQAAQQKWILEKTDVTENISITKIHEENAVSNMHQDLTYEDTGTVIVSKKKAYHPYETERRAHQITIEEIENSENLMLPKIKLESASSTIHKESRDFGSAVIQKDIIGCPYEIECIAQPQMNMREAEGPEDITNLPDIELETVVATDHHEPKHFESVLIEEVKINHPYGTERAAQSQVTIQEIEKMEDISLPDVQLAYAKVIDHQEPKETDTAILQKLKTLSIHEAEIAVQDHVTTEEMEQAEGLSLQDVQLENVVATNVQETGDFVYTQIGKVKVNRSLEIGNTVISQICSENVCKTEDISIPYHTFEEGLTSVQQSEDLVDFKDVVISKGRIIHQPNAHSVSEVQNDEVVKAVQSQTTEKAIFMTETSMDPSIDIGESFLSIHNNEEVQDFGRVIVSGQNIYHLQGEDLKKNIKKLKKACDAKADDEGERAGISSVPKYDYECTPKEITMSEGTFEQKDCVKNTRELLGKHESDTHTVYPTDVRKVIPPLFESVNVSVDIEAENTAVPENRLPIDSDMKSEYEAEHELAKIIHKQMEDLIRDEEPEREKAASRRESNSLFLDTGSLESCENPNVESVAFRHPNDLEKIHILDRVSDELRNMISSLEYNLATGISKNIKITPILARLEQLEQEVANITKSTEATESSIPVIGNSNETDSVISYPQSVPLSVKGAEASSGEKGNSEDTTHFTKMPVILGKETATLQPHGGVSPTGETNGVEVPEALTDVEDLLSDGDQSPMIQRKGILLVPQIDKGAITDTEDMDLSGEEDELIQEKKNLPTIQDLGLLPEPTREVINLTEGFARQPSPLLSGSESEVDDVEGRHKKNIKKMEVHVTPETNAGELQIPDENDAEGLTDVEDMVASGDDIEEAAEAVEDSLPDHYMDQGEGISNKENIKAVAPIPKIFVPQHEDSSDEEQSKKQKPRRRSKTSLKVEINEDGTTDVEDLVLSDKGGDALDTDKVASAKVESKDKPKKKKLVRRKVVKKPVITKTLVAPDGDEGVTDVEILTGDEEVYEDDEVNLDVPEQDGAITDFEDVEASDTDDVETLIANPVQKVEPAVIPAPHAEKVKISETEEQAQEESGADTDEEGFAIEDKDDEKPLIPRKKVSYEPLETVEREALEVEEQCEPCLTDTEDFDMDDKDEDEIITDAASRIPEEGEIYSLKEMESSMGSVSKSEKIKDVDAELKQQIRDAELAGLTLQEALNDDTLTDVEDLEETEKPSKPKRKQKREDETDEESVDESDVEEEISKPPKETKRRGKGKGRRLPLAPQISEVRFVETEQGPLSIIITPDILEGKPEKVIKDQVSNVVFLEDEKEVDTDVEDLPLSDREEERRTALKTPQSAQDPVTDTEDIDIDPAELNRPCSPLPPNVKHHVFASPKRELIYIKEDAHGVPQVTIRKLGQDELVVSDVEDNAVTDTEDIEVSEGEALRIVGVTEGETSDFELPDSGTVEVSTKTTNREVLQIEPEEDGGSTDVEELPMTKKHRRKPRSQSKLIPNIQEDSHTDVEVLSDQDDKSNLRVRTESPNAHTDLEDFEASENELEVPTRDNAQTPDIITKSAIKKVVILKEGPDGIIQTEDSEVAPARTDLLKAEDDHEGITDVEDMEASGAEDEDPVPEYPAVDLPSYESSDINISEKTNLPKSNNEAKHIKDNLLLPEDNYNNLTDVESLSEGEGNRCASNTSLLSSQQLTYAVESCTVAELSYYLPPTDPKLCVHPGVSLESDPFCGELTSPLVVEAELEQVYYHAPREDAHEGEVELEASNGCVVRKRQVVASLCQAREIRRFWSLDRNSPLNQSEIYAFATPTIHKKGFKTILYLEQPNLLDTISISDTLCDSSYFRNERLHDFDSSSIDSFDDHYSYRDSDIVTVVDQFNQESSSSFDELPSPHLSSISSTGIVDSLYSGRSFGSDPQCYDSHQNSLPCSSFSRCSSEDLRKESELTLSLSGISVPSYSTDASLYQEMELSFLDENDGAKSKDYNESPICHVDKDEIPAVKESHSFVYPSEPLDSNRSNGSTYKLDKSDEQNNETDNFGSTDKLSPVVAHPVTETVKGPAVEQHKGFTTECIREYASERSDASAIERTERGNLETHGSLITDCIKAFAAECVENPIVESTEDLILDYGEINASLCVRNSPTGYVQRSITEWIVGQNTGSFGDCKNQVLSAQKEPPKTCSQFSVIEHIEKPVSKGLSDLTQESVSQPTLLWLKNTAKSVSSNVNSQAPTLLQSGEFPQKPFEDSGVHDYQTSGSFTASFDKTERIKQGGYESDQVSLADSVLGLEDQLDKHLLYDVDDSTTTYISAQFSPTSQVSSSQTQEEGYSKEEFIDSTRHPASVVPLTCCYTLPPVFNKPKTEDKSSSHKISDNIAKDFQEISKDFGGVKGLIDQWEVIVKEEQLKSLPSSPAVGRKILPIPFDTSKKPLEILEVTEMRSVAEVDSENRTIKNLEQKKNEDADNSDGGFNVIEEVASVCDIIQQFEGRVGRLGKMNAHRQRLRRGSQSPASRSPSHHRRVATVKPLCEPQLQQENSLSLQERQIRQQHHHPHPHREQLQELLEHTVSAGFVPRVVESLSIAKCSNEIWEENPTPQASVSNPEGTHEAAQIAEQQPTTLSHDQGLDVEEMSNIMESYTSDGSDLITTTTHTTTSIDPDPITSTQITRITRRTEIEDGEVKEEVFEEY